MHSFKGAVTRKCNKKNLQFKWQSRFYEHLINDQDDLARIQEYIATNPLNWNQDKNNPLNIDDKKI